MKLGSCPPIATGNRDAILPDDYISEEWCSGPWEKYSRDVGGTYISQAEVVFVILSCF